MIRQNVFSRRKAILFLKAFSKIININKSNQVGYFTNIEFVLLQQLGSSL
jgi:hypothetical protein